MLHSPTHQEFLASKTSMVCLPKPTSTKNGIPYWDFQAMGQVSSKRNTRKSNVETPVQRKSCRKETQPENSDHPILRTRKQVNGKLDLTSKQELLRPQLSKVNGHSVVNGFVSKLSLRKKTQGSLVNGQCKGLVSKLSLEKKMQQGSVVNGEPKGFISKLSLGKQMQQSPLVNGEPKRFVSKLSLTKKIQQSPVVNGEPKGFISKLSLTKKAQQDPLVNEEPKRFVSKLSLKKKIQQSPVLNGEPKAFVSKLSLVKKAQDPLVNEEPKGFVSKLSLVKKAQQDPLVNEEPKRFVSKLSLVKKAQQDPLVNKEPKRFVSKLSLVKKTQQGPLVNGEHKEGSVNILVNGKKTDKNHAVQNVKLRDDESNGTSKVAKKVNGVNIQTRSLTNGTNNKGMNGMGETKYLKCMQCDTQFKTSWELKEHMWVHTGIKQYPCMLCNLAYVKVSDLIKHCTSSHGIDVTYKCQFCNVKMMHEEIYLNHLRTNHSEELKAKELQKLKSCVDASL